MIEFKCNPSNVIASLREKFPKVLDSMKKGIEQGMYSFQADIISKQMSGPTSGTSVSARTGTLRRDWYITKVDTGTDFVVRLVTPTKYAAVHQFGAVITAKNKPYLRFKIGDQWISKKSVTIPKRLHIPERFNEAGWGMIGQSIQKNIKTIPRA